MIDGKYLSVKGYDRKIPLLWCLDYYSHDPIIHMLAPSESYQAYSAFFKKLKALNYPLRVLVCDEHEAIIQAVSFHYPKIKIQLCTNHYKENIRRILRVRSNDEHEYFMDKVERLFRVTKFSKLKYDGNYLIRRFADNPVYLKILLDIAKKQPLLSTYLIDKKVPSTTNLIEVYNSHLEARVRSLKGFNSFHTAELWLNAYVMNRRLSKFTSCSKKFKYLNGQCSLAITAGDDVPRVKLLKRVGKF